MKKVASHYFPAEFLRGRGLFDERYVTSIGQKTLPAEFLRGGPVRIRRDSRRISYGNPRKNSAGRNFLGVLRGNPKFSNGAAPVPVRIRRESNGRKKKGGGVPGQNHRVLLLVFFEKPLYPPPPPPKKGVFGLKTPKNGQKSSFLARKP